MPRSASRLWSLLELVGSVRLGVVLLLLLAAGSMLGTVILQSTLPGGDPAALEEHYGKTASRLLEALRLTDVFHAPWYHALMGLVALNIVCATIVRFSLRPAKWGFLLAHAGVVLVLLGGLIYFARGDKGILTLAEGETAARYVSKRSRNYRPLPFSVRLNRFEIDYYPAEMLFIGPDNQVISVRPREGAEVTLPWDETRIRFERVIRNARRVTEVVSGPPGPLSPAAHFKLETPDGSTEFWRFALRASAAETLLESDGRIAVAFDTLDTARAGLVRVQPTLFVINRDTKAVTEVPARAGEPFELPDVKAPAKVKVLQVLDDADNTTLGPGLRIQVETDGRIEWRHAFARLPEFNPDAMTGARLSFPEIRFVYYRPKTVLHVVRQPGPAYEVRMWSDGKWQTRPMPPGTPVEVGGVKLTLLQELPAASVQVRYVPADEPTGIEAVKITLRPRLDESYRSKLKRWGSSPRRGLEEAARAAMGKGDELPPGVSEAFGVSRWITTEEGRNIQAGWHTDTVTRTGDTFAWLVGLGSATTISYTPSQQVREYRSEVTLIGEGGASQSCTIRVNHPASQAGWQIFQEGYFPHGGRYVSQLAVSRDPGLALAYVGLTLLMVGVFYACFVKPTLVKRRREP